MTGSWQADPTLSALGLPRSPLDEATPVFDGPAPRRSALPPSTYDEKAWALLMHRHPRKYKRLMKQIAWAKTMHAYYLRRVL